MTRHLSYLYFILLMASQSLFALAPTSHIGEVQHPLQVNASKFIWHQHNEDLGNSQQSYQLDTEHQLRFWLDKQNQLHLHMHPNYHFYKSKLDKTPMPDLKNYTINPSTNEVTLVFEDRKSLFNCIENVLSPQNTTRSRSL